MAKLDSKNRKSMRLQRKAMNELNHNSFFSNIITLKSNKSTTRICDEHFVDFNNLNNWMFIDNNKMIRLDCK